jgi:hypothetical protein
METTKSIAHIKRVINDWGSTSSSELELESSPCVFSCGSGKNSTTVLAERFSLDGVTAVTYNDGIQISENFIPYEKLDKEVINEIYTVILNYEKSNLITYGSND